MVDQSELKRSAKRVIDIEVSDGDEPVGEAWDQFESVATPSAVLALIAENERLDLDNRSLKGSCSRLGAKHAGMTRTLKKANRMQLEARQERDLLKAEIAGLKTGYEAFEQFNAGLKAEAAAISPEVKTMLDKMEADEQAMFCLAATFVRETGRASISALQRNFKLSYGSACRLMDGLVVRGVVTPIDSEGRRTVLPVSVPIDATMCKGEQS